MSDPRSLAELEDAVRAILAWSETSRVPILIIGGVAVSILSKPRTTRDVDVVAWLPDPGEWRAFLVNAERHGIVSRIPDALEFSLKSRVLLLKHDPSGVPIDVSMGALPFEENAVRRAVLTEVGAIRIPLPIPEDLIVMKAVAHRSRDMVDIESILSAHAKLDEKWVTSTLHAFAEALDTPEIVTDFLKLLRRRVPTKVKSATEIKKKGRSRKP